MFLAATVLGQVERWLGPIDAARRWLYRAGVPWLGAWIRDREIRVGLHGMVVVGGSLVGAVFAPLWLLALGPLLLGVPHLVADLRYLVAQPGLHRRRGAVVVGGLLVLTGLTADLRWGLAGAVLAALGARASWWRRALAVAPLIALLAAAIWASSAAGVFLAHAHNLFAVVLWLAISAAVHRGRALGHPARWAPAGASVLGGAVLLSGAVDPWLLTDLRFPGTPSIAGYARSLAPGLDPVWATRWVVTFAYAQAVHYGLWLRVVPEDARRRPSPRSFKASLAALRRDLGDSTMTMAVIAVVVIAVWGLIDVSEARSGYFRLALFHGPLELAVLGLVGAEGVKALRK